MGSSLIKAGRKTRDFIEQMEGLIRLCSAKRINIRPGTSAKTDGVSTIYLPWLPNDATDEQVLKFFGFAAHEQAHFYGKTIVMEMSGNKKPRNMTRHNFENAVDDIRCENLQEEEYPGLKEYRKKFYALMYEESLREHMATATRSNLLKFLHAVMCYLISKVRYEQLGMTDEIEASPEVIYAYNKYVKDLVPRVKSQRTFKQALELGGLIYDRMKDLIREEMEKRTPPPPKPEPKEPEDESDSDRGDDGRSDPESPEDKDDALEDKEQSSDGESGDSSDPSDETDESGEDFDSTSGESADRDEDVKDDGAEGSSGKESEDMDSPEDTDDEGVSDESDEDRSSDGGSDSEDSSEGSDEESSAEAGDDSVRDDKSGESSEPEAEREDAESSGEDSDSEAEDSSDESEGSDSSADDAGAEDDSSEDSEGSDGDSSTEESTPSEEPDADRSGDTEDKSADDAEADSGEDESPASESSADDSGDDPETQDEGVADDDHDESDDTPKSGEEVGGGLESASDIPWDPEADDPGSDPEDSGEPEDGDAGEPGDDAGDSRGTGESPVEGDPSEDELDPEGVDETDELDPFGEHEKAMREWEEMIVEAVKKALDNIEEHADEIKALSEEVAEDINTLADRADAPYMVHESVRDRIGYKEEGSLYVAEEYREAGIRLLGSAGSRMTRLFVGLNRPRNLHNRFEGRFDMRSFTADALDRRMDVYNQKIQPRIDKAAVSFMIDNSSSMGGTPIERTYQILSAMLMYLSRASICTEAVGFTADSASSPQYRDCPVYLQIVKKFDDPYDRNVLQRCVPPEFMRQNAEVDCLRWMVPRLYARPEKKKVLFILGDGAPCIGNSYLNIKLARAYREYVGLCRQAGIIVFGFGIGCDLSWVFGDDYISVDSDDMGDKILDKLTEVLNRPSYSTLERAAA
jgi:hypothetical protein